MLSANDTLDTILQAGRSRKLSIVRYGDGEMRLLARMDRDIRCQRNSPELCQELRDILQTPEPDLLVGLPTRDPDFTHLGWDQLREYTQFIPTRPPDAPYVSAWIGRAGFDAGGTIDALAVEAYWCKFLTLFNSRRVWVVSNAQKARWYANSPLFAHAEAVSVVPGLDVPDHHAYAHADTVVQACQQACHHVDDIVVLMLGPAATCVGARLSRLGIQALDLGRAPNTFIRIEPVLVDRQQARLVDLLQAIKQATDGICWEHPDNKPVVPRQSVVCMWMIEKPRVSSRLLTDRCKAAGLRVNRYRKYMYRVTHSEQLGYFPVSVVVVMCKVTSQQVIPMQSILKQTSWTYSDYMSRDLLLHPSKKPTGDKVSQHGLGQH